MAYDGGYYLIKQDLVRSGLYAHSAADPDAVSPTVIRAVNLIQETPWMIDTWVLDLMREFWVDGNGRGVLPAPYDDPVPGRLPDSEWDAMSPDERTEFRASRSTLHAANGRLQAKREYFLRALGLAETYRDYSAIYFPHFVDFRGRIYPLSQDLHPQGDGLSRALLKFARGKALGKGGAYWLAVHVANTFGNDKLSFAERVEWVVENEVDIIATATNPHETTAYWSTADDPWPFLAACREWYLSTLATGGQETFVSHLSIPLDGTCNGLQHLSLMGRDPVGARATNCSKEADRLDLYTEIAEVVKRRVSEDAARGVAEAHNWIGEVTRNVVKRSVMTTPYGVTPRGIQNHLLKDGHVIDLDGSQRANAEYMKDQIVAAVAETVVAAKDIMTYFQDMATALAKAQRPLKWTTPTGMRVTQAYHNLASTTVSTLVGRVQLLSEAHDAGLNVRKQALAASPNVVHSCDAAMLAMTALTLYDKHGITDFAFVHDSYATHAADTGLMARTLREVAVDIYKDDWLRKFHDEVAAANPDVELPEPPPLGDFNVAEVLDAPYFFA